MSNGKKNGQGTYTWANGDRYEGQWRNDSITGKGTFTWHTGEVYTGEWLNDMKHGYGKLTWPDGDIYEGLWEKDEFKGKVKLGAASKAAQNASGASSGQARALALVKDDDVNEELIAQSSVGALVEEEDANYSIKGQKGRAKKKVVTMYKIRNLGGGHTSYLLPAKEMILNRPGFRYLTWQEVIKTPFRESDIIKIGLGAIGQKSEIQSMCRRYGNRKGKVTLTLSNKTRLECTARLRDARTKAMKDSKDKAQYVAEIKMIDLIKVGARNIRIDKYHEYDMIRLLCLYDIVSIRINGHEFDMKKAGYAKLLNEVYSN